MIYSNNKTTLCGGGGSNRTIYTNSSSSPTLFDTLYTDSDLTTPWTGVQYAYYYTDSSTIFVLNTTTGQIVTQTTCP